MNDVKYEKSLQNEKDIMIVGRKTTIYSGGKQWEEPRSSLSPSKSGSFHLQIPACSTANRGKLFPASCMVTHVEKVKLAEKEPSFSYK